MTIKDIAKAANVSAATVSRIINHKDDNISQETRERVLRVIEENDYVPYAKIRDRILSQSRSIGLIIPTLDDRCYVQFASELQQLFRERGYSMVLALSSGSADAEETALENFVRNRADGVIIFSGSESTLATLKEMHKQGIGVVMLDHYARPAALSQIFRNSAQIAGACTRMLLDSNSSQIALVLRRDNSRELQESIIAGYSGVLMAAGVPVQKNFIVMQDQGFVESIRSMADLGLNGIVCQDADVARAVYAAASNDELRIPEDISVISMEDTPDAESWTPALTAAATDVAEMARMAFECLLSQLEHTTLPFSSWKMDCPIRQRCSVQLRCNATPKILVAGYINTDILLRTPDLPRIGRTQVTTHIADYVGGRGANQSYGVSKLGGNAYLLGCLGSDRRGRFIHDYLAQAGVKLDGVSFQTGQPTGIAYISLYPEGKSSVLIDPGANNAANPDYICQHEQLLMDAAFCLAQTDIHLESVAELHRLCRVHHVPMILRPSYGVRIPDALVDGVYVLIMKEQERQRLYPEFPDQEASAAWFLSLGAENVIFTEDRGGCFWADGTKVWRHSGYDYPCIDETGTSDVFIACLATLRSEGFSLEKAVEAAVWAAAYSTTKMGVQSGFPDRKLLEDVVFGGLELQFRDL